MPVLARDFDDQGRSFDDRVGLPEFVASAIAHEIARIASLKSTDLLLEIGAGTGQIGQHLGALPGTYLGFDASPVMLEIFAQRSRAEGRPAAVVQADGSGRWPAQDGSVAAFFSSRAIHLLPGDHVVAEVFRAASPTGAFLLVGRIRRGSTSVRSSLRQEMRTALLSFGFAPADGHLRERLILDACCAHGAARIEPATVAAWPESGSAASVIESWRAKEGLAGLNVPGPVKAEVLLRLEAWAIEHFGSLSARRETEENYVLEGVRLPPK